MEYFNKSEWNASIHILATFYIFTWLIFSPVQLFGPALISAIQSWYPFFFSNMETEYNLVTSLKDLAGDANLQRYRFQHGSWAQQNIIKAESKLKLQ